MPYTPNMYDPYDSGKSGGYYMTHSYPPGAPPPQPNSGIAPIPRGPRPTYSQERMHGDGYLSSPERSPRPYGGGGSGGPFLTPTPSYEDPYYPPQYPSRSGSVTPIIDEEARSAFYSMRVEQMERQLASLTGLVQKALHTGVTTSPRPDQMSLAPPPAVVAAQAAAAAAAAAAGATQQPPAAAAAVAAAAAAADRDTASQSSPRPINDFLQVPTSSSYTKSSDLRLSPEVYNQLRVLQKKAKELRTDVRNLRKTSQANTITMKDLLRETVAKITTVLQSGESSWMQSSDADRARVQREEASYRQDMMKLDKDLCDLELKVEELRNNVINRRLRVNMSDVENMAVILSRSSKTVADLKAKFPILQDGLKELISAEMERAICNEKFLKEEPDKLESALRRCKKLTGTLVTLKRLASVQEQRVPPGLPGPLLENGDPRDPSSPPSEDPRAAAAKVCVEPQTCPAQNNPKAIKVSPSLTQTSPRAVKASAGRTTTLPTTSSADTSPIPNRSRLSRTHSLPWSATTSPSQSLPLSLPRSATTSPSRSRTPSLPRSATSSPSRSRTHSLPRSSTTSPSRPLTLSLPRSATSSPSPSHPDPGHTFPRHRSSSAHFRHSLHVARPSPATQNKNSGLSRSFRQLVTSKPALTSKPNVLAKPENTTPANDTSNSKPGHKSKFYVLNHSSKVKTESQTKEAFNTKLEEKMFDYIDYSPEKEAVNNIPEKVLVNGNAETPKMKTQEATFTKSAHQISPLDLKTKTPIFNIVSTNGIESAPKSTASTTNTLTSNTLPKNSSDTPDSAFNPQFRRTLPLSRKRTPTNL